MADDMVKEQIYTIPLRDSKESTYMEKSQQGSY